MTTTSATKTRALCVATRCTSVDQFVATFHRFCGDDQTFFVATMTSRPIGLETAFSIQLADKQPVLRGLCVVLDAWPTPENRYKRPGIRLGIKRLTAESQVVFDRLRAASRSPSILEDAIAIAEATPPSAPPPLPALAGVPRPATPSRAPVVPPPLPLPSLLGPRTGLPSVRSASTPSVVEAKPSEAKPSEAKPSEAKPVLPPRPPVRPIGVPAIGVPTIGPPASIATPVVAPPSAALPVPAAALPGPTAVVAPPAPAAVVAPPAPAAVVAPPIAAAAPPAEPSPRPAPISVTRFQVALNVDTIPPPISDVEFKPTELPPRLRSEPRIPTQPPPADEELIDPSLPALIIDRPTEPTESSRSGTSPGFAPVPAAVRALDAAVAAPVVASEVAAPPVITPAVAEPAPIVEHRTPGGALVLPANPLQNLSDESLEGFVDCTIYEETGNFFHPGIDGPDWSDELADPPSTQLATRAAPATVPAMPFDAPPNLTVRAIGDTESLRVAPDDPPPVIAAPAPPPVAFDGSSPRHAPSTGAFHGDSPEQPQPSAGFHPGYAAASGALYGGSSGHVSPTGAFYPGQAPSTGAYHGAAPDPQQPAPGGVYYGAPPEPSPIGPPGWFEGNAYADGSGTPAADPTVASPHGYDPSSFGGSMGLAHSSGYPAIDGPAYPRIDPAAAVTISVAPLPPARGPSASSPRWLVIGGSAALAIVVAFLVARMVRGSELATVSSHATPARSGVTSRATAPSAVTPSAGEGGVGATAPAGVAAVRPASPPANAARTGASRVPPVAATPPVAGVAPPAGAREPDTTDDAGDPDDSEAAGGVTPVVGSGPCRFTVATTPAGSIVRLDDQVMGPSPLTIEATCEKHKIEVSHARYVNATRWVTLIAGKPQELGINLSRPTHAITVTSSPSGAELSIEGRRAGTTPTVIQMMGFATVRLRFSKPGYQSVTKKVYSKVPQDRVFVKLAR